MPSPDIRPGDTVMLLDAKGKPVRGRGGIVRGRVLTVDDGQVVVALARTGSLLTTSTRCLRRCPALAYCRPPVRLVPGAA